MPDRRRSPGWNMVGWKACVLAAVGVLAVGGSADAAKGKKKAGKADALFAKLDTNNDGKLSKAEFAKLGEAKKANKAAKVAKGKKKAKPAAKAAKGKKKAKPAAGAKAKKAGKGKNKNGTKSAALFDKLDADKDGFISKAEFAKLKDVKKANKAGKKAKKAK